jgi:transketolase N-terminal domain/subunit
MPHKNMPRKIYEHRGTPLSAMQVLASLVEKIDRISPSLLDQEAHQCVIDSIYHLAVHCGISDCEIYEALGAVQVFPDLP